MEPSRAKATEKLKLIEKLIGRLDLGDLDAVRKKNLVDCFSFQSKKQIIRYLVILDRRAGSSLEQLAIRYRTSVGAIRWICKNEENFILK